MPLLPNSTALLALALPFSAIAAPFPLFQAVPDLSADARGRLVVHFDGRAGVAVNGHGGVTAWEGRDGDGNAVVTALRQGNNGFNTAANVQDNSDENANISHDAVNGRLVFTENAVYETAHLYVPLVDDGGNNLLVGGASTIFWVGSYSGENPQGNGTLGRYAYNITSVDLNVIGGGFNHQRRNADANVGAFITNNTGGSSQTRLGSPIGTLNDTPTVWTSVYDFDSATRTMDFFATDSDGNRTDLGIADPTTAAGKHSFADITALPNLYIGSISYPFFYDPHGQPSAGTNGGFSFIGEMRQLLVFEGVLHPDDIAAVEAWLVELAEPGEPPVIEEPDPLFVMAPGLSAQARDSLVGHLHSASGVTLNDNGTVTGWTARDGNGNPHFTAELAGSGSPSNITRKPDGSAIVFTEPDVADTMHLHTSLDGRLSGGDFTIFWRGHYSGANPQGNGVLGRYAYNVGIRPPGTSGNNPGLTHQRRNAAQNVAVFPGSQTTYLGDPIAAYNDTPTVWTTLHSYTGGAPFGWHRFFATDAGGSKTDLNVAQPTTVTAEFDTYRQPHLYLGAYNDGVTVNASQAGFTFIGEMSEFLLFDEILDEGDIAVIEAHLRGLPPLVPPSVTVDPANATGSGMNENFVFSATPTDPGGLDVEIQIDWGDGRVSGWLDAGASGMPQSTTTIYPFPGSHDLRVRARNADGVVSNWMHAGSVAVTPAAGWPEGLVGHWTFADPEDPLAATVGADLVAAGDEPVHAAVVVDDAYARQSLAGVIETAGGAGNHLVATHHIGANGGGFHTNVYSLLFDVLAPSPRQAHTIYQADPANGFSGVYAKRWSDRVLGAEDIGFSDVIFPQDEWRRLVITVDLRDGGHFTTFINGVLAHEHMKPALDSGWALDAHELLLFAGTAGDAGPLQVATAAIFDRALDPMEVAALGGPGVVVRPAVPNSTPVVAVITGPPGDIATGELAAVSLTATDADGDDVQIRVDWGGGRVSPWSSFAAPGVAHEISDNWMTPGTRAVRAQARDRNGAVSPWVEIGEVTASHQPTPERTDGIKIVCYNVWVHFANRTRLNETAAWLRGQNADFIGLQELSNISDGGLLQLSHAWGHPHAVVARETSSTVGLTSRHPIEAFTRHTVGLHRPVIQATTGGYEVFVVHLAFGDLSLRLDDLAVLGPLIEAEIDAGKKVIVMGDFNSHMESDDPWLQGQTDLPSVLPAAHLRDGYFDYEVMNGFLDLGLVDVSTVPPGPDNITFPTLLRENYRPQSLQLSRSYRVDFILVDESIAPRTTVWFPRDRVVEFTSDHYPVAALIAPDAGGPGDAYALWISGFPGVGDPSPLADADGDGIPNILEFILNGNPMMPGSAILPSSARGPDGGLVFSFVRRAESKTAGQLVLQVGSDLVNWSDIPVPDVSTGVVAIEVDTPSPGLETVTIAVDAAEAANGRVFGRLQATTP